jgi:hypothetical protein
MSTGSDAPQMSNSITNKTCTTRRATGRVIAQSRSFFFIQLSGAVVQAKIQRVEQTRIDPQPVTDLPQVLHDSMADYKVSATKMSNGTAVRASTLEEHLT